MLKYILVFIVIVCNVFAAEESLTLQNNESKENKAGVDTESKEGSIFQLDEIVVTGSRVEKLLRESPGSLQVVSKDKVISVSNKNTGDAISNLTSIDVGKRGTLGSEQAVLLRGISSEGNLILLDGVPLNSTYVGGVDLSSLLLDNVERIEVLKGPASSLYGANAVGGVVNVITKDKVEKEDMGFSTTYGSFNTQTYKLIYSNKFGPFSLNLGGSNQHSDGERLNSRYDSLSLNGNVIYNISEVNNFKFNFGGFKADRGSPGRITYPTPSDKQKEEKLYSSLNGVFAIGEESKLKINLYGSQNILNFYSPIDGETLRNEKNFDIETQYNCDFGGINVLTVGGRIRYDLLEQNKMGNKNATTKSLYAQDIFDMLGSWIFTASVRYDNHSVYGDNINPLFAVVYNIEDGVQVKGSFGTAFRAPTFSDLYWVEDSYSKGNPNLKPEKSTSYDIGVSIQFTDFLLVKETFFRNDLKDMIQWLPIDPADLFSKWMPTNVGRAATYGLETELKLKAANNLTGYVNHTLLTAKDMDTNLDLIYRPKNKVNLGIEYKVFNQTLNIDTEYYDIRLGSSGVTMPKFITTNLKFSSKITDYLELTFSVSNLENVTYEFREGYPMPGRTFSGGISIKF